MFDFRLNGEGTITGLLPPGPGAGSDCGFDWASFRLMMNSYWCMALDKIGDNFAGG